MFPWQHMYTNLHHNVVLYGYSLLRKVFLTLDDIEPVHINTLHSESAPGENLYVDINTQPKEQPMRIMLMNITGEDLTVQPVVRLRYNKADFSDMNIYSEQLNLKHHIVL